eukprot:CAMPEP_0181194432 /NCGR_PEP_ID=MMETSP1096-20121128/14337_1 /TAXON_ID=156174 ORGANISM="Chrysochromulina ericina, Strain CCMP281" /NCGR_SAMPLE_ID=MMETSP1096 /ASSEMBLY_ACC=CAM_ASM_000453 /LENGTH=225 /DNA_ID=CAMNT_0023283941 /DNA_START=94 /DNA_END=772 /DNA_ORIENTATION=-
MGGCPVKGQADINPANSMPVHPNQSAAAGQRIPLPTARVESTIPTAGGNSEDPNWVYPSEQMFFNAMRRKGFTPKEEDMRTVVAIHNTVNEQAWQEIMKWESLHPDCTKARKLARFEGKPDDPTLKARFNHFIGYNMPFDRHDWFVMRCGREVRYLIDFYQGAPQPAKPIAMHIDARPAGDDLASMWDRVRMPFQGLWGLLPNAPNKACEAKEGDAFASKALGSD